MLFSIDLVDPLILFIIYFSDLILTDDQLKLYTLADIEMLLRSAGKTLLDYPAMPTTDSSLIPDL